MKSCWYWHSAKSKRERERERLGERLKLKLKQIGFMGLWAKLDGKPARQLLVDHKLATLSFLALLFSSGFENKACHPFHSV